MNQNKKLNPIRPEAIDPRVNYANSIRVEHGGWPGHTVGSPELVLVVAGEFRVGDADHADCVIGAGHVVLIRPQIPCDLVRVSSGHSQVSCIHFELIPGLTCKSGGYTIAPPEPWIVRARGDWVLNDLFLRCAAEYEKQTPLRDAMLSAIFREIWLRVMRHTIHQHAPGATSRMEQMIEYLRGHLTRPVTRHDLAEEFKVTPEHINYLFKHELNTTPTRCLQELRVRRAAELLSRGRCNVAEAARDVGFNDPFHFSRTFRRIMGFPPSRLLSGQNRPKTRDGI